jgi:hypothetical protein
MKHRSTHIGLKTLLLAGCLAVSLAATHAAQPSLQTLLRGKWSTSPQGSVFDVKVVGNYAYVADFANGLQVIDVSDPVHCVRVGSYDTSGYATGVAASGRYAYVADDEAGLPSPPCPSTLWTST